MYKMTSKLAMVDAQSAPTGQSNCLHVSREQAWRRGRSKKRERREKRRREGERSEEKSEAISNPRENGQ